MWPSFRSKDPRPERGFTLVEVLVAMTVLVVVVILSMSVLIAMKRFSQRQQIYVEPRQTARRGVEYLSYFIRNSGARVIRGNSGLVAWRTPPGNNPGDVVLASQASFNNLDDTQAGAGFGDEGTDLITLMRSRVEFSVPIAVDQPLSWGSPSRMILRYAKGCNPALDPDTQNANNLTAFRDECQCTAGQPVSFYDQDGAAITAAGITDGTLISDCDAGRLTVEFTQGLSPYNRPGLYPTLLCPACALGALEFTCFRVHNGQLQQLQDAFNPAAVPDDTNWTVLLENVEDMQIAYVFDDGSIWNDDPGHVLPNPITDTASYTTSNFASYPAVSGGVPLPPPDKGAAVGQDAANGTTHLSGFRISVVARSTEPVLLQRSNRYSKPAVEDGAAGAGDNFYHHRITATVMIRNQMLGY